MELPVDKVVVVPTFLPSPLAAPQMFFPAAPDALSSFLSLLLMSHREKKKSLLFFPVSSGLRQFYDEKFYKLKIKKFSLKPK